MEVKEQDTDEIKNDDDQMRNPNQWMRWHEKESVDVQAAPE